MNFLNVSTAATKLVKQGPGYLQGVTGVSAGTNFAFKLFDGINVSDTSKDRAIVNTAIVVSPGVNVPLNLHLSAGLIITTSGTPGELILFYY